jgi:hypothetical protein
VSESSKNARDKVRRFISLFLSIAPPEHFFHQTLTFPGPLRDEKEAKRKLKKLLERSLFKGVIYVQERHGNEGIHFHLLLYFYEQHGLPFSHSQMRRGISAALFAAWNELNDWRLTRRGNVLREHRPDFQTVWYLTLETQGSGTRPSGGTNWWGVRNARYLITKPPAKCLIRHWMKMLYPRDPLPDGLRITARRIAWEKRTSMDASIGDAEAEWEDLKMNDAGSSKRISDAEYLEYRKGQARRWRERQRNMRGEPALGHKAVQQTS